MNILILPSFIYSKSDPTLGSFIFEQAIALKKAGHKVYVLYCDTYSVKEVNKYLLYEEDKYSILDGIEVFRNKAFCPMKHSSGFLGCRDKFVKEILRLYYDYLQDKNIDIIHAHCCAWAGYAAMKLSEEKNIPYVITEHSTIYALGAKKIKGQIKKDICLSYKNASSVICVSQALQNLIRPYCNNSIVIGNVIDCNLFHNEPKIRDKNNFTFLTVCYMKNSKQLKKKGIDILVKAFQKVIMVYPNVRLNIGGDGAGVKYLKKWILEEGIDKNVNLLGELSRSQVSKEMQNSDVFVLPSRYETFGVVYAEAMASGKPVIATRTGGPDSFVDEKTGFLIDVENEEQLKDAMINIIEKFECYNPFYIRNKILGQFSMDAIGTKLTNLYNKINGEN